MEDNKKQMRRLMVTMSHIIPNNQNKSLSTNDCSAHDYGSFLDILKQFDLLKKKRMQK